MYIFTLIGLLLRIINTCHLFTLSTENSYYIFVTCTSLRFRLKSYFFDNGLLTCAC